MQGCTETSSQHVQEQDPFHSICARPNVDRALPPPWEVPFQPLDASMTVLIKPTKTQS